MKVKRMVIVDTDAFKVGDIIEIKLTDGVKAEAMAMKQEEDGMIFCLEQEKNGWIRADIHPDANPVIAKVAGECCSFRILRWVDSKVAGPGYFVVTKEGYMIGPYDVEEWRYIF